MKTLVIAVPMIRLCTELRVGNFLWFRLPSACLALFGVCVCVCVCASGFSSLTLDSNIIRDIYHNYLKLLMKLAIFFSQTVLIGFVFVLNIFFSGQRAQTDYLLKLIILLVSGLSGNPLRCICKCFRFFSTTKEPFVSISKPEVDVISMSLSWPKFMDSKDDFFYLFLFFLVLPSNIIFVIT